MTEPTDTESLIAGHFDGMNSPAENALLTELLLSDPRAAESFVEAARFEAMLEQRMPLVKSRKRPLWLWLGAAAALAAAGFFALRLLPRQDSGDHETPADGELKWEPVKDARVPLTGHSAWALQAWEQMQMAEPDSFVPAPEVTLEEWRIEEKPRPSLKIRTSAKYPEDWNRKINQARSCSVGKDGVIDLGEGKSIKLGYIALASPLWPESKPASWGQKGFYWTPPVYFDLFGRVITGPERISNGKDIGLMSSQSKNHSTVELGLDMAGCPDGRVLSLQVFDTVSHAWLSRRASWSSLADLALNRVSTEALIPSSAPVTIALEVAVPAAEMITLPATPGSKARTSLAEAQFVKGSVGIWARGSLGDSHGNIGGWEELELQEGTAEGGRFDYRPELDKTLRNQSCTLTVSLPGELEADLFAVTDSGEIAPLKGEETPRYRWLRPACFLTPLESVRAVKIKPYSRRRVLLTVTPPRDPWSGLNAGITDVMELRIPSLHPQTDDARIALQMFLGIDEPKTYRIQGEPQFKWLFGQDWKHDEMKNASLREVLLELGRKKQQEIEIEVATRQLRSVPGAR